MHEGLHDHRPQGPVDAPTGLQQRREEAAVAQLGNGQLYVAGPGRPQPGAAAVAMGGAVVGALVAAGADLLGRLQVDEGLQHELHGLPQEVEVASRTRASRSSVRADWSWAIVVFLLRDSGKEHAEAPAMDPPCGGPSRNRPLRASSMPQKTTGGRGARCSPQTRPLQGTLTGESAQVRPGEGVSRKEAWPRSGGHQRAAGRSAHAPAVVRHPCLAHG